METNHRRELANLSKPENMMDKFVAAVLKDTQVVGHLTKVQSARCDKIIFSFLRANQSNSAVAMVKGKKNNYGDGKVFPAQLNSKEKQTSTFIFIRQYMMEYYK